jgi:hypothetical protein
MASSALATWAAQQLARKDADITVAAATHKTLDAVLAKMPRDPERKWGENEGVASSDYY